jgi:hypothetical protein
MVIKEGFLEKEDRGEKEEKEESDRALKDLTRVNPVVGVGYEAFWHKHRRI